MVAGWVTVHPPGRALVATLATRRMFHVKRTSRTLFLRPRWAQWLLSVVSQQNQRQNGVEPPEHRTGTGAPPQHIRSVSTHPGSHHPSRCLLPAYEPDRIYACPLDTLSQDGAPSVRRLCTGAAVAIGCQSAEAAAAENAHRATGSRNQDGDDATSDPSHTRAPPRARTIHRAPCCRSTTNAACAPSPGCRRMGQPSVGPSCTTGRRSPRPSVSRETSVHRTLSSAPVGCGCGH